ncbi:MAG: hypothetical protein KatS3mg068_0592 [Candidatus Sericytochromatia bacterium]|nr:MAG: hypothetical protein KatS3mg068_0592 [Candidatus Sericytochromatia bacterium]
MPKEITHIYFSDKLLENLKDLKLYQVISKNIDLYYFGSIATDTFYYNIKLPFDKTFFQYGDLVHGANGNDTSILWWNFLEDLKKDKENYNEKISFISGFITHCVMDINFHPYVYYFSGNYFDKNKKERKNAQMRHRLIEAWLDLYVLKKLNIDLKNFFSIKNAYKNDKINLSMLYFLCEIAKNSWNLNNTKTIFYNIKRGYFIQKILNLYIMNNSFFREIFRKINNILRDEIIEYLALFYPDNKENIPDEIINFNYYLHPFNSEKFSGNINNIFENAIKQGFEYLKAINDFLFENKTKEELSTILVGYSLDLGLYGVSVEKAKYFSPLKIKP